MRLITLVATPCLVAALCLLSACNTSSSSPSAAEAPVLDAKILNAKSPSSTLDNILAAVPEEHKARHGYRNPKETLEFFGIKPGMVVVEYLPGGGWYSQILAPLLGPDGTLIGADYSMALWPNFPWMNDTFMAGRIAWPAKWTDDFAKWGGDNAATPYATTIPDIDSQYENSADAALFIRAVHNLARFESKGQFLTEALEKTYSVLKPGGIVGIVQHQASEDKSDDWADGSAGYLKKSFVIETFEAAGFEFVSESNINENKLDQPGDSDIVWRLPPSYSTSKDDAEKKAEFSKIGESNRMTLLFKKPNA